MDIRMTQVSLEVRNRRTGKYGPAKPQQLPLDPAFSYSIRFAGQRKTLKDRNYYDAMAVATTKRLEFLSGIQQAPVTARKPKSDDAFDVKMEAYLVSTKEHKSHKTWLAYSLALKTFYAACQCSTVAEVTEETLKEFVTTLKAKRKPNGKKLSDRSISNILDNVVRFLRGQNVTTVTLKQKYVEKTVRAYRPDEVHSFFKACAKIPEMWLLFQFFLCTGAREQEVMNAFYSDIDVHDNVYNVTMKKNWNPKGYKEREIPIPDHLVEALLERKKTATSKLIFPAPCGRPNGHMLRNLLAIVEEAQLEGHWDLHKWRKTYATLQARDGVDVRTIQERLGHEDIQTTLSYLEGEDARSEKSRTQANSTFGSFAASA
jgi:integrase/recombinase XerD